jgi:hypothetical protein
LVLPLPPAVEAARVCLAARADEVVVVVVSVWIGVMARPVEAAVMVVLAALLALQREGDAVTRAVGLEGKLQLSVTPYRDHVAFFILVLEIHETQMRSLDLALQAKFLRNYG